MAVNCPQEAKNQARCTCTYPGCPNHALCCECLHMHLAKKQLPGCCFPTAQEKHFDRSFAAFASAWKL